MLTYKNINGEQEAVLKKMVVRFSRKEDLATGNQTSITFIHLANGEKLKSSDSIVSLLKKMNTSPQPSPKERESRKR